MLKKIIAAFLGFSIAVVVIYLLELMAHEIYVPPSGTDFTDRDAVGVYVAGLPTGAFLLILFAFAMGSVVGGAIATAVAGKNDARPAWVVGVLLTVAGAINVFWVAHPLWFAIVSMLIFLPFTWLGGRLVQRKA